MDALVAHRGPFRKGDHLFRLGEQFHAVYAVRSGVFKTYVVDREGREHVLGFYMRGDILGLGAIYPEHYLCNAQALTPAVVCEFAYGPLDQLAGEIAGLRLQMMRLMSRELANHALLGGDFTAEERIATFLVGLSERLRLRGRSPVRLHFPMSRRDIANYLRLATETVSRVLARFQEEHLIDVHCRDIRLLDLARLRARCIVAGAVQV